MLEGTWTAKLLKKLRERMSDAVVIKNCNPYVAGVPDFMITKPDPDSGIRRTSFYEVKLTTSKSSRDSKVFVPLQLEMCRRLGAFYIIWSPPLQRAYMFRADEVRTSEQARWLDEEPLSYEELVEKLVKQS